MGGSNSTNVPLYDALKSPARRCDRCGRKHTGKRPECRDCHTFAREREPEWTDALTGGRWVNVRGIQRWEATEEFTERVRLIFTEEERKEAHRRHWLGCREPSTVAGEREYHTARKRAQRETAA